MAKNTSILAAFERMWQHVAAALGNKSDISHNHDDFYYTEAEIDNMLSTKSDSAHTHAISEVTDLQTTLDTKVPTSRTINGKALTSNVTLSASDVGADASGSANAVQENLDDHISNADAHFTAAERTKLSGIAAGAQVNTVTGVKGNSESSYRTGNINITKANIGLGSVDNTSDANKPVSTAQQSAINASLASANDYTDTAISNLINSAPTTLDTLGEIAAAMKENADVVEALEASIGTKANASDLTSHTSNKSNPHGVTLAQLGVTATAAELNKLDGVTATAAEINKLDGLTATTAELNYVGGATSNIQAQLDALEESVLLSSVALSLPSSGNWYGACYGDGKFVAIVNDSNIAAYSSDGINWTQITLPLSDDWRGVAYGNGMFMAVAYSSSTILYSTNGISWSTRSLPVAKRWVGITFGGGKFVIITYADKVTACSSDGVNWTTSTVGTQFANDITYGDGKFVITSNGGSTAAYSCDGVNWTTVNVPIVAADLVAYGNGMFVAITDNGNDMMYSEDGITWQSSTLPASLIYGGVCYGSGVFAAVAYNSNVALYSSDGINWTQTTMPSSKLWKKPIYANGRFISLSNGANLAISYDGINWSSSAQALKSLDDTNVTQSVKNALGIPNTFVTPNDINSAIDDTHNWTLIYDSGGISDIANSISNIDVSGYTNFEILVRCYNDGDSVGSADRAGAVIFTAQNGKSYQFPVWTSMFSKSISAVSAMAQFKLIDGWLVCPYASKLIDFTDIFDTTEGGTACNLVPSGSGMMRCTSPLSSLAISNYGQNSNYYFGVDSRVMVWGWNA